MHFVTGGTFNGKRAWVVDTYRLEETPHLWISFYDDDIATNDEWNNADCIIYEGIEIWIKRLLDHLDPEYCREAWRQKLSEWKKWEEGNEERKLILIGNDISKGIVPLDQANRLWRDMTGWCYQETTDVANRMDLIWYGIHQQIK